LRSAEAISTQNHRNNRDSLAFKHSEYFSDAPSAHDDEKQRQVIEFDHLANNASLASQSSQGLVPRTSFPVAADVSQLRFQWFLDSIGADSRPLLQGYELEAWNKSREG